MPNQYLPWGPEEDAVLVKAVKAGCSLNQAASEINAAFGTSRTSNSIVSRAKKLGAGWKNHAPKQLCKHYQKKIKNKPKIVLEPMPVYEPPPMVAPEPKTGYAVTFNELRHYHCRYPLGGHLEPAELYCGDPIRINSPYCEMHHKLCYVPPRSIYGVKA